MLFLGREAELKQLIDGCKAAIGGRGGVHLVAGEPGIGKTRLADEVASAASTMEMTVAWGRAWETGGAPPFYPWIEALDSLGIEEPVFAENRPARGESVSADAARERFAIFDRVNRFLHERSRKTPLLLVFDDLHAADLPSLELLHFVSRSLRTRRIAVIGTLRDVEARRGPAADVLARISREVTQQLALHALATADVAMLVEEHLGQADQTLASELIAKTEGNPLFVHEALRMVSAGGSFASAGALAIIASRTDGLSSDTRSLLDLASVFGRRVVAHTLATLTGASLTTINARLRELVERDILRPRSDDGSLVFSHALIRDAFYERVDAGRREELHQTIAEALAREDGLKHAALIAHHMLEARSLVGASEVVRASVAAAEAARVRLAPEDAVALLERTFAAVEDDPKLSELDRIELLLAIGWAATESGRLARGRQVFREANRRATAVGDPNLVARAALGQGGELVFGEVREELVAMLRSALAGLPNDSALLRARLLARLAAALQPSDTPEEPLALAAEAMKMAAGIEAPRVRAEIALAAGSAFTDFAPPSIRIPVAEELVRTARSLDDGVVELRGLTRLATDWIELGDFAKAESVIDARAELAARLGHPRYLWQTPLLRSMLAMPKGAFAACDDAIEEALAIGQEGLDVNAAHVIAMHRFWMLLLRGDTDGLHAHEEEVLRAMRRMPEPGQHHALVRAVITARSGDAPALVRGLLAGIGDGKRMLAPMMLATIADVALLSDDTLRVPALYAQLSPTRGRYTAWGPFGFVCGPPYDSILGSLASRLGPEKRAEALGSFEAALDLTRRSAASACEAWVYLARAEAHVRWGEPADAAKDFAVAARLAKRLGMNAVLARAEAGAGPKAAVPDEPVPAAVARVAPPLDFTLQMQGKDYVLTCNGRTTQIRAVRGLPMLARLLEHPNEEMHALDLASDPAEEGAVIDRGDSGEALDAKARAAYQRRVHELREEIEEADRFADIGRADRARRELDMLVQQLSNAVGLGGRARRVGAAAERARISVQRRVREAIKRIAQLEPELGRHLDYAIRTGMFCAYEPLGRKL